jgi:dynein heavy chain
VTFKREIVRGGNRIHNLIGITLNAVEISEASPGWQEYINFTNDIIFNGFKISSLSSLTNMFSLMSESEVEFFDHFMK